MEGTLEKGYGAVSQVPKALGIWNAGQFRNVPPFTLTARRLVISVKLTSGLSGP